MINGNEIPDFGSRLKFLIGKENCNKRGISQILAKDMLSKGLIEPDEGQTEENCISYSAKSIRNHLKCQSCDSVSAKWISVYMRYFNCSADFLLGKINAPTYRTTNICDNTGLSIQAAELLQAWKETNPEWINHISAILLKPEAKDILHYMDGLLSFGNASGIMDGLMKEYPRESWENQDNEVIDGLLTAYKTAMKITENEPLQAEIFISRIGTKAEIIAENIYKTNK